jgi:hypothetical protein
MTVRVTDGRMKEDPRKEAHRLRTILNSRRDSA